jgi:CRISPR system Cascade subunit CasD
MATLLLRLCGPMQSWGTQSRFSERDTDREPSKSAVVGLLCAALGRRRNEPVDDLAALVMGVRVDAEGHIERDYHTAGGVDGIARASGGRSENAVLSNRYYLADADFLVGLESDDDTFLQTLEDALRNPAWQIFLGRKSFVPSAPVYLPGAGGIREKPLFDTLKDEPWPLIPQTFRGRWPSEARELRFVIEDRGGDETRMDQPLGAAFQTRTFGPRRIKSCFATPKLRSDPHVPQPSHA